MQTVYEVDSTEFEFQTTGLIAIITDDEKFCWAVDLYAKANKFEGETVSPKFSFAELGPSEDYEADQFFRWKDASAYDEEIDDWIGSFYIFDGHYFIADVEITKEDQNNYLVSVNGKVNLNWETAPTTDFREFSIQTAVPFNGILCKLNDEAKAFEVAKKYLNTEGMKWTPKEETSSGDDNWLTF